MEKRPYSPQVIETLYFLLKNAVLDANLTAANMYLGLLTEAFQLSKENFKILNEVQKKDLLLLKQQVKKKQLIHSIPDLGKIEKVNPFGERAQEEVEIQSAISHRHFSNLLILLEIEKFQWGGVEIPTHDGYVDIVLDKITNTCTTRYLFELKAGVADHRVVGQIRKYEIFFLKRLIYKLWDQVQGVVIANGYSENALRELKKNNVITLVYQKVGKDFKYSKV